MNWSRPIDAYCERLGPAFWAEPVNALTNLAFILAALILWRRTAGLPLARALCVLLFIIGIGSFLFHTRATLWAGIADTAPIGLFILTYLFAIHRDVWAWPLWLSVFATLAFIPFALIATPVFAALPVLKISAMYWPVPLLILIHATLLRRRSPATARGVGMGAALLTLSLVFRSLDQSLCPIWPTGTHFIWHLLNALMLGWMIEVYRRHLLAGPRAGR
jgi:Ceramidase